MIEVVDGQPTEVTVPVKLSGLDLRQNINQLIDEAELTDSWADLIFESAEGVQFLPSGDEELDHFDSDNNWPV